MAFSFNLFLYDAHYRNGVVAFLVLLVSSALIFYYSRESCPLGSFTCSVQGGCIPKEQVCDGTIHCPNEEDEDTVLCADTRESIMDNRGIDITNSSMDYRKNLNECAIQDVPAECRCEYTFKLVCSDFGFHVLPQNPSPAATHLVLIDVAIESLSASTLLPYTELRMIHLEGNGLTYLPPNIFRNQKHLQKLILMHNNLTYISTGVISGLVNLQWLFLDYNDLEFVHLEDFQDLVSVEFMTFSYNKLNFDRDRFPAMPKLIELFIDHNEMTTVRKITFENLVNINLLSLRNNKIETIDENAFYNLVNLKELDLHGNNIKHLPLALFKTLVNLDTLYIGHNPFDIIPIGTFENLINLVYLNIEGIEISNIRVSMFRNLEKLESIYFKKYSYCHYISSLVRCRPFSDGISSNSQLLYKPIFRYTNWLICFATCTGNVMVLCGRFLFRDENKVLNLVIKNLAVSDFLMGIYLLLIGIQDMRYRNIYYMEAQNWVSSWGCTVTGMIAMVSSEVSVMLLVFMSIDRFFIIAIPFGKYSQLTMRETTFVLIFIWGLGIILAVFPALEYLSTTRFYGVNGLCFPLHIDDPFGVGWEYSAVIFFGINATALAIIAFVYAGMFISIWKTRNATSLQTKDYQFAIRFFFIVLTDVTCWLPIITVKAVAMMGATISADLYGWLVVFILPINSALNPVLYTFTTPRYRTHIMKKFPSLIKEAASFSKNNGNKLFGVDTGDLKMNSEKGGNINGNNVKLVLNKF